MPRKKPILSKDFFVKPDSKVKLKNIETGFAGKDLNKALSVELLDESRMQLAEIQDKLYAHNKHSVLIVFQAMDAAGKDGAVKHIMSGFNPLGVKVFPFKAPSSIELDHNFLWRHQLVLPARGEICIFNRSHYENVLVTRVHPEYILGENLPGIDNIKKIDADFWKARFKQINRFEKNIAETGTLVLKFFLHVSKKEQKKRFLERINDPTKNWKFSSADLKEREYWDAYQNAYEEALSSTSKPHAPWFIVPADDKWFTRLAIANIILEHLGELPINYPNVNESQKKALEQARLQLIDEKTEEKSGKPKGRK